MAGRTAGVVCVLLMLSGTAIADRGEDLLREFGFEDGKTVGWQLHGPWKLDESAPHSGRYAIRLDAQDSQAWNKVLSASFVARVYQGDELALGGFYKSATGNADIGLEFCDVAGEHLKWSGVSPSAPAENWTRLERRFTIDEELWRLGVRTVRIYAQVTKAGSDVCYDDLRLGIKRKSPEAIVRVQAIQIDPISQGDLLRDGFESFSDGVPDGWKAIKADDETGKIESDAKVLHEGKTSLRVSGVRKNLMLVRPPIPIDPKVSYGISCRMKCEHTDNGRGILKAVLLDAEGVPTGDSFSEQVGWYCDLMEKRIEIPYDRIPADATQLQVSIGVRGECPGSVWFDDLRIAPCALTLSASSSQPHNLFHTNGPAGMTLKIYNGALEEAKVDVSIVLADFRGRETKVLEKRIHLAPRTPTEEATDLKFPSLGHFRATVRASRDGKILSEMVQDMALVTPFSEAIFAQDSPFGSHEIGPRPELIHLMREAYVKWVRTHAGWTWAERERGKYDWAGLERHYKVYFDSGISPLVIVTGCPEWNSSYEEDMPKTQWGGTHGAYPPRDYGAWTDFCAALAGHFKGRIKYWEVRNEPNCDVFWMGTPQDYAKLLRTAYIGLHRGNPDCQVIFEVAGTDMAYYDAVYKAGGKGYCDILGTHNYQLTHPGPPEKSGFLEEYYDMKKFLARRGEAGKTIWDTEFCWMSASPRNRSGWKGVGEENQADYLVRSWALALSAGVEKVFWFPFHSYDGAELNEPHPGGLVRADYSIKPVFVAHRTMAERLVGAKYSREIDVGRGARCYVFAKPGREIAIVWAIGEPQEISLATNASEIAIFDIMNNRSALPPREGLLTVRATGSPVYLVSPQPFEEAHGAVSDSLLLRINKVSGPSKFERRLSLSLKNLTDNRMAGRLAVSGTADSTRRPAAQNFDLPPRGGNDFGFQFAVESSARFHAYCALTAEAPGVRLEAQRRISLPASLLAAPVRGMVAVDGNPSEWAEEGRASVVEQDDLAAWRYHKVFAGYDEKDVYLAVSAPKGTAEGITLVFDLDNDGRVVGRTADFLAELEFSPGKARLFHLDPATEMRGGEVRGTRCWYAEADDETSCEIALPRDLFRGNADAGKAIGLGIVFNGATGCCWPPVGGKTVSGGTLEFTWRAPDGSYPQVFRKGLPEATEIHSVRTRFPSDMAFRYEIFASEKENPSDDLASPDWKQVAPLKVGSGSQTDIVNTRARRLATRLSNLATDCSFEEIAVKDPVKLKEGQEDIRVWQPDRPYCAVDGQVSHSGKAAAYIPAAGRSVEPRNRWSNWRQILPAKPGAEYTLSGYVRIEKMIDGQARFGIHSFRSRGGQGFSIHDSVAADPGITGWQRLVNTFQIGPEEDRIRIYCDISLNGAAWFDDVHVVEGSEPGGIAEIVSQRLFRGDGDEVKE